MKKFKKCLLLFVISQNVRINIQEIILWKIVMLMRELLIHQSNRLINEKE